MAATVKGIVLRVVVLAACAWMWTGAAWAQDESLVELFGGYSYGRFDFGLRESGAHGVNGSAVFYLTPRFGVGGELGWLYWKGREFRGIPTKQHFFSLLAGPQVRLVNGRRAVVSARAFLGAVRQEVESGVVFPGSLGPMRQQSWWTDFGAVFGGSFDWNLGKGFAWRVVQPDVYLRRGGGRTRTDFRISTGIVFRFGRR